MTKAAACQVTSCVDRPIHLRNSTARANRSFVVAANYLAMAWQLVTSLVVCRVYSRCGKLQETGNIDPCSDVRERSIVPN